MYTCIYIHVIPYSWKLSRMTNFATFSVLSPILTEGGREGGRKEEREFCTNVGYVNVHAHAYAKYVM